jgi:hypothetical protein
MAAIGKVSAVFTASTSGLTSGVKAASSAFRSLQSDTSGLESSMRALTAIAGAQLFGSVVSGAAAAARAFANLGAGVVSSISSAVDAATSLGEETSKSGVIFGQSAARVAEFAKQASRIGLAESAALSATGSFGNLFTAMGLGREQAADYATTLTSLGADLASFNNSSVEEAVQALGAALRGEAEPIRRFGVLLDEATLKQEALARGLITSTSGSLTPAIKAQAAYAAILRQTASAQGDFARTSGSLANLSRIVSAQSTNVFSTIGQTFEPLYRAIAEAASNVLVAIGPLFESVADGVRSSVEVIAAAIARLTPQIIGFLGSIDGANIGQALGDGLLSGARALAVVGDALIANSSAVFSYFADVGTRWTGMFDLGGRVAQAFYGAFRLFEFVGNTVGGAFSDIISGLLLAAAKLADVAPGFGDTARDLRESSKGWEVTADNYLAAANSSLAASGAAFSAAFTTGVETGLPRATGPLTTALDSAANALASSATTAAATITSSVGKPVEVQQTVVVDVAEALKGIDSRSSEGVAEMFRIMRGTGGDVQEQQLGVLERIADAVETQEADYPFAME